MDKEELISLCLKDDRNAQTALFNACYPKILAYIRRYIRDPDTGKDILQEVFVKIFSHLHTLKNIESFDGWCRQIAVNACLYHIRKQKKDLFRTMETLPEPISPEEESTPSRYDIQDVYQVLDQLPLGYRTVFNLFAVEKISHKEIAQKLGISESTSKTQFFKAKKMIENIVKQKHQENG